MLSWLSSLLIIPSWWGLRVCILKSRTVGHSHWHALAGTGTLPEALVQLCPSLSTAFSAMPQISAAALPGMLSVRATS